MGPINILDWIEGLDHARHIYMSGSRLLDEDAAHSLVRIQLFDKVQQLRGRCRRRQAMVIGVDPDSFCVCLLHAHVLG